MCYLERNGNMTPVAFIIDVAGANSAMHSFSSQVGKRSSSQNLLTDLLMILSTVAMSTVCSPFKGTPTKEPPTTEDINK